MRGRILYLFISVLLLAACSKQYLKQKESFSHYSLKENTESQIAKVTIAEYKVKVDAQTEKVIASSSDILTKESAESTLGNFVCDALKYSGEKEFKNLPIDVVMVNRGGLRVNLPKGDIKVSNIFELMPFENDLILVKIKGEKLLEGVQIILEKKHSFLGIKIKEENGILVETSVNGTSIDKEKIYTVVTSDYLANGGDNFIFLKDPVLIEKSKLKIREAIINYCIFLTENKKQIVPYTDGRLQISK